MDYLDPSLGGTLAFLDQPGPLHAAVDSSSLGDLPSGFEFHDWVEDGAAEAAYDPQPMFAVPHPVGAGGHALLDTRAALAPVAASHPFGVLGAETGSSGRMTVGGVPSLAGSVSTAVGPSGAMHLSYGGPDFGAEFLAPTTSTPPARAMAPRSSLGQQVYTPVSSLASSVSSNMGATDPSTFSIAAYGNDTSSRNAAFLPQAAAQPLRMSTRSSSRPLQSSSNLATVKRSGAKTPKTPQADESVPEAALHLLRLAGTAEGSAGSVATNSTGRGDDGSGDEDAEGESDDTSIHSTDVKPDGKLFFGPTGGAIAQQGQIDTRVWLHDPAQPPLHVQRGGGPGSRRPSAASSATSTRYRQHIPARTQREASVGSMRSRGASEAPSVASLQQQPTPASSQQSPAATRRSGRVRKSVVPQVADLGSDTSESEAEYKQEDADADASADEGKGKKKKGAKSLAVKGKGKGKRPSVGGGGTSPKKARVSAAAAAPEETPAPAPTASAHPPRKARRQAFIPENLRNRTFPPTVTISADFPRFYRAFPVSAAFPPESYVLKTAGQRSSVLPALPPQPQQHSYHQLPHAATTAAGNPLMTPLHTPPMPIYDQYAFPQYQQALGGPIASSSSSSVVASPLPSFAVDPNGNITVTDFGHLPTPPHSQPGSGSAHHATTADAAIAALANGYAGPSTSQHHHHPHHQHDMSPPQLPTASTSASTSSAPSPAASVSGGSVTGAPAGNTTACPSLPGPNGIALLQPPPETKWNKSSDPLNLYWPRFVKGNADDKMGMCPVCAEPKERGGGGEVKWLKLKNSSYVYHMSYAHGLSNITGLPFSPPVQMRVVPTANKTKDTRSEMTEGLCHKCNDWVPILSIKNVEAIVPELIWWKHAKKCHGDTTIAGEAEPFVRDEVYDLVVQKRAEQGAVASAAQAQAHAHAHAQAQAQAQAAQAQMVAQAQGMR
ncbi:hypothetical protein JCM6882_001452 [Rhodosporidiobolus microsporus]